MPVMTDAPIDARALANVILDRADEVGHSITNMALQKILYFGHGWYLARHNQPLINLRFEAWEHGPVIPIIYHQFKAFGDRGITSRSTMIDFETGEDKVVTGRISEAISDHIETIVEFYAPKSGPTLSHLSHEIGGPWHYIRTGQNHRSLHIPDELIRAYFVEKLTSRKRRSDGYHA